MVNKVILIGNLGSDPEVKQIDENSKVARLRIATSESYKDKTGNKVTQTEWHTLEMWNGLAGIAEQYLKKGSSVYVEGRLKTDEWETKEGEKRYATKIRVTNMTMLGGKPTEGGGNAASPASNAANNAAANDQVFEAISGQEEDDLPF